MSTPPTTNERSTPEPLARFLDGGDAVDDNVDFEILDRDIDVDDPSGLPLEPPCELPSFVVGSGFEAVQGRDFQRIGIEEHETRITVIRIAARRATTSLWESPSRDEASDPSHQVAELVWTTYRLIDPRYRNSPFQQIRVGRILPLVLSYAACMDLIPLAGPTGEDPTPNLFGHRMPVVAPPFRPLQATSTAPPRKPSPKRAKRVIPVSADSANEAMQAFTELRSFSASTMWRTVDQNKRFLIGLMATTSAAAVILSLLALRLSMSTPEAMSRETMRPPTPESTVVSSPIAKPSKDLQPIDMPTIQPSRVEEPLVAPEPAAVLTEATTNEATQVEMAEANETPTGELMTALAGAVDRSEVELKTQLNEMSSKPDATLPLIPKTRIPIEKPTFKSGEIESATDALWRNTPSAARRFTGVTIGELIDQWEFEAELSGNGTLEHAAASRLSLQAAWLAESLSKIIARLRDRGPVTEVPPSDPTASSPGGLTCCHLPFAELTVLVQSWQAARKRVVVTDDLNQMLHQGTVLLDRILVSDRLQPNQRTELIETLLVDVTRLASLAKDETLLAEFQQITEAMSAFPDASEFTRLESAEDVSGFLGRVRCLKQRQWSNGLSSLTQTAEPALASCAKAEWELQQSQSATTEDMAKIAERWSKIAVRLPPREAASVRLHALELYGNVPQYAKERQQLLMALPRYVAPLTQL